MIRRVFVPLDGSPFSEHALPLAIKIAESAGARLQLARVHQPIPSPAEADANFIDSINQELKEREEAYLDDIVHRLARDSSDYLSAVLLDGEIAASLKAQAADADLVVMTTHCRGPFARFWLGSVADELIRVLHMPVLLVRPRLSAPDFIGTPSPKQMLVALDGTTLAEQVLEPALTLGTLLGATITLIRVVKPALLGSYLPERGSLQEMTSSLLAQLSELQRQLEAEARSYLESIANRLANRGIKVEIRVLVEEQAAAGILREADASADMIALATHGRHGLSRLLLGSVANTIVRGSALPVLVYRPRQI